MIVLAVAVAVIAAAVAKAFSMAGMELSPGGVIALAVAAAAVFGVGEALRRSPKCSSCAVVGPAIGTAVAMATAVGWLDSLAGALGVDPAWGYGLAGVIWLVAVAAGLAR